MAEELTEAGGRTRLYVTADLGAGMAVTLDEGQAIYIDSDMGHAYITAPGCHEAEVLGVMSSPDDDKLMQSLLTMHEEQSQKASASAGKGHDKGHEKAGEKGTATRR